MFEISKQQLCRKLLLQRKEGIRFFSYMGPRYFVSKAGLLVLTILLFWLNEPLFFAVALVGSGYLVGMILAHLRTFMVLKNTWPVHQELIDWDRVKEENEKEE